jgi:hypothetical protein
MFNSSGAKAITHRGPPRILSSGNSWTPFLMVDAASIIF